MLFYLSIITILVINIILFTIIIHKLPFIKKINNKLLSWIISLFPTITIFILFNYINTLVIIIHIIIIFFIISLISFIIKRKILYSYKVLLTIILTIIYLSFGAYLAYHIFETKYEIYTNKEIGKDSFKIIQISDAHIGTTFNGNGFLDQINKRKEIESDIVVITGDFVDDDTKKVDMIKSCYALSLLKPTYGIYFIYGNHDRGYFNYRDFKEKDLINELEKNNIKILKDEIANINDYIYLIGRDDKTNKNRKSINELVKGIDKEKYLIDLNHQPNDYDHEQDKVDLVLSGHSHGGQLFPLGYISLLMGSNDEFYGLKKRGNTNFIVSSGISDWAVSFKTGTKSEYVIINILKK